MTDKELTIEALTRVAEGMCPACGDELSHHPPHRDGEFECFNDECWLGSFFPDRLPTPPTDDVYQGWEITTVVHSDDALCGEEQEVYIIKAETEEEAHEQVSSKRAVKRVETDLTEPVSVDAEGLRVGPV